MGKRPAKGSQEGLVTRALAWARERLALPLGLVLLFGLVNGLQAQTVLVPAAADSYLRSGNPNQNQGSEQLLRIQSSGQNRALVRMDPAALLAAVGGGYLVSARLELSIQTNTDNWGADGRTVEAHRIIADWSETGVTWNCGIDTVPGNSQPDCASLWEGGSFAEEPSDVLLHANGLTGWIGFEVTADVRDFLAGAANYGWLIKKTDEGQTGQVDYTSRQGTAGAAPRLVLVIESATADSVPPRVTITAPDPVVINDATPQIAVGYFDGGSGVDLATLHVFVDTAEITAGCTTTTLAALCEPPSLAAGTHTVRVTLSDRAGNAAEAVTRSFDLLVGPGLLVTTLPAIADTYLQAASPNQNQGSEAGLRVRQSGPNRALVKVDSVALNAALAGGTIRSARLELFVADNGDNWGSVGGTVDAHRLTASWTELGATWNCGTDIIPSNQQADCIPQWNGGVFHPVPSASVLHTNGLAGWVAFDVTQDLVAFLAGDPNHGWLLKKTLEGLSGLVEYTSRQGSAGQQPRLVVGFQLTNPVDDTPPQISALAPAAGSFLASARPTLECAFADDLSGVNPSSVRLVVNGTDFTAQATISGTGLSWTPVDGLPTGSNTAQVSVADRFGNQGSATWSFTVDPVPPLIDLALPAGQTLIAESTYTVQVLFGDLFSGPDLSTLQVAVAGVDLSSTCLVGADSATCPSQPLTTGQHAVTAEIRDLAGNVGTASGVLDLIVDLVAPTLSLSSPSDGAFVGSANLTVAGTAADDGTLVSVLVNGVGATVTAGAFSAVVVLEEGANEVLVLATDSAGKQAVVSAVVILDTRPPTVTIQSPVGSLTNQDSVRVAGTAVDENGIAGVEIAGTAVALTGDRFEAVRPLADGVNRLAVRAVDAAGNQTTANTDITRVAIPEVVITSPADLGWIAATTVSVAGNVSPDVTGVTVNGVVANLADGSFTASAVPLVEGGNLLTAAATGGGGRVATDTVSVVRDLQPPGVVVYGPANGAVVATAEIAVFGLVNDIVPGTVNAAEVSVIVNGRPAEVSNRSFLVPDLPLAPGANTIVVLARDEGGNESTASVGIERRDPAGSGRLEIVSGNRQVGVIGTELPLPLIVRAVDATGLVLANVPVLFKVSGNNGSLDGGRRQLAVVTDSNGEARARFSLGTRVGVASQRVEAKVVGVGEVLFLADALSDGPSRIVVDAGDQQLGVAGQELPRPLVAVVTDEGYNRLEGVSVRFTAAKGHGQFANGQQEVAVETDSDGRAIVPFRLDPEEGTANNVVIARIESQLEGPFAAFVSTGWASGEPHDTAVSGVVLDNSNLPVGGVTIRIKDTPIATQTNSEGVFRIQPAPVGTFYLIVDGSTVTRAGSWPDLEFVLTTVAGRDNTLGMPVFLLPLSLGQGVLVDETRGGTITLPEVPGFALEIQPGSVTFPGGSRSGFVSVTAVHSDKVPMVPNFGQQPRFIVTIQPAGARFDPPARLTLPNLEGLAPGQVTEMYSFDHDLGHFVSIGPATVSEDGTVMVANQGVGVIKAGWHCGGDPPPGGTAYKCPECWECVKGYCAVNNAEIPTQRSTVDCKKETCLGGATSTVTNDNEIPPPDAPGNCKTPRCENGRPTPKADLLDKPEPIQGNCREEKCIEVVGSTGGGVVPGFGPALGDTAPGRGCCGKPVPAAPESYDLETECCGRFDVQPKRPLTALVNCPDRVQNTEAGPPFSNGCSWPEEVPEFVDRNNPAGGIDTHFSNYGLPGAPDKPCDVHDVCWGQCMPEATARSMRTACDETFCAGLERVCDESAESVPSIIEDCHIAANTWCVGVQVGIALQYYRQSQLEYCQCCP